jgi:hypothetical protein
MKLMEILKSIGLRQLLGRRPKKVERVLYEPNGKVK